MTCSIAVLIACFSWSGFYMDGAVVVADGGAISVDTSFFDFYDGKAHQVQEVYGREQADNPYARAALGYEIEFSPRLRAAFEVSHRSSIATGRDRGINSASFSLRWYPFRRH